MAKYFRIPFASGGSATTVPDTDPGDGSVNYTLGYGPKYSLDKTTDPSALSIERVKMNELWLDVTTALQQLQQNAYPPFISTAANGGTPYSYSKNNAVTYTDGEVYVSLINTNTDLPTVAASWANIRNLPKKNRDFTAASPATLTNADGNGIISIKMGTPAALTFNLPALATITPYTPFEIKDANGQAAAHPITITANGSETIESQSTFVMDLPYAEITLYTDGTEWKAK